MSSYWSRYCCDPFKHHRRRIYSHLRIVPASLIAEHPSLSLQSGVVACCNCLKAVRECSPESKAPDVPLLECAGPSIERTCWFLQRTCRGPSSERAGPSNERAGPSSERASPSNECAGPSNERADPSNECAGPSNERAGPGNERVHSQEHLPVPFQAHQLFLKIVMMTVMPYLIYLSLMKHFPLMESLLSTTRNVCGVKVMSYKK